MSYQPTEEVKKLIEGLTLHCDSCEEDINEGTCDAVLKDANDNIVEEFELLNEWTWVLDAVKEAIDSDPEAYVEAATVTISFSCPCCLMGIDEVEIPLSKL